jgi:surface protein
MEEIMNKYKLYMIVGIVLLVLSIAGSLAYYVWSSSTTSIAGNLCLPEIYFTGGATINGKLKPVSSKEEGLIKEIEVNLHKTCNNDTAVMNLYLSLDLLPTTLQENTFVYELYNGNNERISSGNFSDKKQGDTITLASNEIVTSDVSIYTLYIYIDGNRDNPITMSNNSFRFNIYGEGTGAIYKENVIQNETTQPSSSSSTFLNTEVLRNQIESITIEKNNIVPNDAKYSKDISSKQDGSVMLWYTDKDNNSLYEVSIGSENGSLEANTNGSGMFSYLDNVDTLDLTGLDTSNMTSMSYMFYNSNSLKSINLSNFNTSKLLYANNMFNGCTSLESLDLSNFNTSKVTNFSNMFRDCQKMKEINLSNFDTSSATTFANLFHNCSSLTTLDLSSFNTNKVTYMGSMFYNCSSLTSLDLSNFNTSNVINMGYGMFYNCKSLKELDLSSFNTNKVTFDVFHFSDTYIVLISLFCRNILDMFVTLLVLKLLKSNCFNDLQL